VLTAVSIARVSIARVCAAEVHRGAHGR